MKKIAILVLALLMCFSCVSCVSDDNKNNSDSSTSQSESQTSSSSETSETSSQVESSVVESSEESSKDVSADSSTEVSETPVKKGYEQEVVHCMFTDSVLPADFEASEYGYFAKDGEILIDLKLSFKNLLQNFTYEKSGFEGFAFYDGGKVEMQVEIESECDFNSDGYVRPNEDGFVHLFCAIDAANASKNFEVKYSIYGDEYSVNVTAYKAPKLQDKIKLEIGKTYTSVDEYGTYSITVSDCYISENFYASAMDSAPYYFEGCDSLVVVATVKNERTSHFELPAYAEVDGKFVPADVRYESDDKKTLPSLPNYGFYNEEKVIYFAVGVPKGSTASDGYAMRINLGNKAFYCMPKA